MSGGRQVITLPRATPSPGPGSAPPTGSLANGLGVASAVTGHDATPVGVLLQRPLAVASEEDLLTPLQRALRALDLLWHLFERARETNPLRATGVSRSSSR